ncbi:MAG: Jag N-terminal domain-containing protein, partial [Synergistaceae bacterium]|nr:Jag N-terminal domain-containing protein [Synergistaceae bacterium]
MSFENEEGAHKARERREERERRRAEQKLVFEVSDVNEALELASKEWEIDAKSLKAEVLSSERGFLGLFGNKLKVEVTPVKPLLHLKATRLANDLLSLMGMDAAANLRDDGTIEIEGADAADYIIGHYGDALKSIEYLLNLILRDPSFEPRLRIDCCGYRERRTRSLERLAEATARQALDYGRPIRLDPMLSWERWVIHTALKNRDDVRTESVGEPPLRKVVIMPRFDAESGGLANPNYNSNRRGGSRFSAGRGDRNYNSNSRRSSSRFSSSRSEHSYNSSSRRSRGGSERSSRDFDFRDDKNFRD